MPIDSPDDNLGGVHSTRVLQAESPLACSDTTTYIQLVSQQPSVTFVPIAPQAFNRYEHQRYTEQVVIDYVVQPLSRCLQLYVPPTDDQVRGLSSHPVKNSLAEWIPHQHPEGALYFRHISSNIFTDADLHDPGVLTRLALCMDQLLLRPRAETILKSNNVDLVLDIITHNDKSRLKCGYYFVDHAERVVFWLDPFHMNELLCWGVVPGITTATHVKLGLEIEYWRHCDLFPSAVSISAPVLQELRDLIVFSILDSMTSPTTTVGVPADYLHRMLSVVDVLVIDEVVGAHTRSPQSLAIVDKASGSVVGRFMGHFAAERFYNFNGERCARLDRTNSVYGASYKPSYLFILVSLLLFNSPIAHRTNINMMFKDGVINSVLWNKFIRKLHSEWQGTVLFGTLILNANIGFLAISSGKIPLETPAQVSSYISVFFGLGSIMIGLVFSRQYGQEFQDAAIATDATYFFRDRSVIGLDSLAIVYSLPYAFMIWGMITFLLAFLMMAVQSLTGAIRLPVIVGFSAIILITIVCVAAERVIRAVRMLNPRQYVRKIRDISCV